MYFVHEHSDNTTDKYWYFKKRENAIKCFKKLIEDHTTIEVTISKKKDYYYHCLEDNNYIEFSVVMCEDDSDLKTTTDSETTNQ